MSDDIWSSEIVECDPRVVLPKVTRRYREALLRGHERIVLDAAVDIYRRAPGKPIAFTIRQMAEMCGVSRMTAQRAVERLRECGFIALIDKGSYEVKRLPSRYRMTMFECGDLPASHDYIDDHREWRRQRKRRGATDQRPKPTTRLTVFNVPMERAPALAQAVSETLLQ